MKLLFSIFLFFLALSLSSQDIKVSDFKSLPLDVSARANPVIDANGDVCAVIKIRTGLTNLKFSSDLGINKYESNEGEFWLWVSPFTRKIIIVADSIGKTEYELPIPLEKLNVYVLSLIVLFPDNYQYKEVYSFHITTKPKKAEVFIDKIFMGYSPVSFNLYRDTFNYEIFKKRRQTITGSHLSRVVENKINIKLEEDLRVNRLYLNVFCLFNKINSISPGIEFGALGKTGFFISFVPALRSKEYIAFANSGYSQTEDINLYWAESFGNFISNPSNYYYCQLVDRNNVFFNHFRFNYGLTQRILKNTFIKIGLGYAISTKYYRINVIQYSNNPETEVPLKDKYYAYGGDEINSATVNLGMINRQFRNYLINLDLTAGFNPQELGEYRLFFEASLGIGYQF